MKEVVIHSQFANAPVGAKTVSPEDELYHAKFFRKHPLASGQITLREIQNNAQKVQSESDTHQKDEERNESCIIL